MPYKVCKQCGKAFPGITGNNMGRPRQYCDSCSTSTAANARSRARKLGREAALPESWSCWICREHSDDKLLYPFCSDECRDKTIPSLARQNNLTEKQIKTLIDRGGLWIALQDPTFSSRDLQNLCEQIL